MHFMAVNVGNDIMEMKENIYSLIVYVDVHILVY